MNDNALEIITIMITNINADHIHKGIGLMIDPNCYYRVAQQKLHKLAKT